MRRIKNFFKRIYKSILIILLYLILLFLWYGIIHLIITLSAIFEYNWLNILFKVFLLAFIFTIINNKHIEFECHIKQL